MQEISATDLARKLSKILDEVTFREKEFMVIRNNQPIARILPGPEAKMTALEAMSDLYRTLPEDAAKTWLSEARLNRKMKLKNPWDS